jgi:hypothetical protein
MEFRRLCTAASIVLSMIVSFCPNGISAEATFILTDGRQFDSIPFKVDHVYKVVTLMTDSVATNVSFDKIQAIIDINGMDVTNEVLRRQHKAMPESNETWLSESDEVVRESRKRLWNFGMRLGGNFSSPFGDYYNGTTSGIGFEGDFRFALSANAAIRLRISKSGMEFEDVEELLIAPPETLVIKLHVNAWRYFIAGEYFHRPDRMTPGRSIFFVYSGAGAIVHNLSADATLRSNGIISEGMTTTDTETKFLLTIGGGMVQLFSKNFGFELSGELDIVFVGSNKDANDFGTSSIQYAYLFDIKLGLVALW